MKKVIISIIIVVFILAGVAMVVLYNMGDFIIEEAIKNDLMAEVTDNTGDNSQNTSGANQGNNDSNISNSNSNTGTGTKGSSGGTGSKPSGNNAGTTGNSSVTQGNKQNPTKVITSDEINKIKGEVSAGDKITAATLVLKRLSGSDISYLKDLLAGGLTAEEKKKAEELAYSKFTSEEMAQIKEMYKRYMN